MKIMEREKACLDLLGKFPEKFILIGGYAISSYDFPRFSVDLDLLIKEKDLKKFSGILIKEGFSVIQEADEFSTVYKGKFLRLERKVNSLPVSADILVSMVQCRQTNASYSFEYVWKNSEVRTVIGYGLKSSVEARVADREMLIALKVNSMRTADIRDIISLCNGPVNVEKVISHLKRAPRDIILSHAEMFLKKIGSPGAKDSIKGVFGISDRVYERLIENSSELMRNVIKGCGYHGGKHIR